MTSTFTENDILVTDARGRVRLTAERKAELLAEFDRSGMTVRRFAEWSGVHYQTFSGWLARRKKRAQNNSKSDAIAPFDPARAWTEAILESPSPKPSVGRVTIVFPGQATMDVSDVAAAALAAEVLRQWANLTGATRGC